MALFSTRNLLTSTLLAFANKGARRKKNTINCVALKKVSKGMFNKQKKKKEKNNEQKFGVLVGVFLQTFRAWPFIS